MKVQLKGSITIHELLSWLALFLLATNPYGIMNDLIKKVGLRLPLLLAISGASGNWTSERLRNVADKFRKGGIS